MRLPPPPSDFACLAVSMSQLLSRNIIMGSYEGTTFFANELPPIEQINRQIEAELEELK